MRGLVSMVMAEADGKKRGGVEEDVGGGEEGAWGRAWTTMEDMLLVYWCCTLVGGRHSEPEGRTGTAD